MLKVVSNLGGGGGGGPNYQGTWNASTNTPTLVSSVGTTQRGKRLMVGIQEALQPSAYPA
ncbi:MAG: hypothetical protein EBS18_00625 [Actinobacteria bacterium]|nr:hypothetical protein [Actinomycetota bacterium]